MHIFLHTYNNALAKEMLTLHTELYWHLKFDLSSKI